jgi:hypothetical protein
MSGCRHASSETNFGEHHSELQRIYQSRQLQSRARLRLPCGKPRATLLRLFAFDISVNAGLSMPNPSSVSMTREAA